MKITDFGIARLDTSNLTQEGQLLGTPNYMAPEQIQGKEVDHRADLFSLGVVLYEMLTRHKPFQGENLTVVSHRIVYDHFTPPREYARDLPPGIDRILGRALEKDPARRYQRAKEMVDDLRQVVEANATRVDALNETQSLSSTMVLPPSLAPALAPPVPAARPGRSGPRGSFMDRLRGRAAAPTTPPPLPLPEPAADGTGTGTGSSAGAGSGAGRACSGAGRRRGDGRRSRGHRGDRGAGPETPAPDLAAPSARGGRVRPGGVSALLGGGVAVGGVGAARRSAAQRHGGRQAATDPGDAPGGQAGPGHRRLEGRRRLFYQAEQLAPNAKKIRAMRVVAQLNAGQQFSTAVRHAEPGRDGARRREQGPRCPEL